MNSRTAWFWAFAAAVLFLTLVAYERFFYRPPPGPEYLLPGFDPMAITAVQVLSRDAKEIQVERTNGTWRLTQPVSYPAQTDAIEALLESLQQIIPVTKITGTQLRQTEGDRAAFGLDTPRASLVLSTEAGRQQVLIGALTPPGDQVFVQVAGRDGIYVIGSDLLRRIPVTPDLWRDTGLCAALPPQTYDRILVTTGDRTLELKRETTNQTWWIVRPMLARADEPRLETLVQSLRDLRVQRFVSDDPRADHVAWGLHPAELQIAFSNGSNTVESLQFGAPVDEFAKQVYAIGREPGTVVLVSAAPLLAWQAAPNEFRDRQLLKLPRAVLSIEFTNSEAFTLVNLTNDAWRIEPQGLPADVQTVHRFLDAVENLHVSQFVKDVVSEPDLPAYGLATPKFRVRFTFQPGADGQSVPVIGLDFGQEINGQVYVRRTDENAVYAVPAGLLETLPAAAGHFRQRALWNFAENQVASIRVQKGDSVWQLQRTGRNQWSLAPGSQGIINAFAVEEAAHRLGQLHAVVWTDWGDKEPALYGLGADAITLTIELKDGGRRTVQFGFPAPSGHVYAGTLLEGATWVFEFPSDTFDLVQSCLIKPSNLR